MGEFVNGVDVQELGSLIGKVRADPSLARFRFQVTNRWDEGGHSETTIDVLDVVSNGTEVALQVEKMEAAGEPARQPEGAPPLH